LNYFGSCKNKTIYSNQSSKKSGDWHYVYNKTEAASNRKVGLWGIYFVFITFIFNLFRRELERAGRAVSVTAGYQALDCREQALEYLPFPQAIQIMYFVVNCMWMLYCVFCTIYSKSEKVHLVSKRSLFKIPFLFS
jgi:hypothetical protein